MKTINRITVITSNYPMQSFPGRGAFVENLVLQWERLGLNIDVVAPYSWPIFIRALMHRKQHITIGGKNIVRPRYMSFSNKKMGFIDFKELSRRAFFSAAIKGVNSIEIPNAYYGKFLISGGMVAATAGEKYNRPSFADLGESTLLQRLNRKEKDIAKNIIQSLTGIVCVSERLKNEAIELGGIPEHILLIQNEANRERFKPIDRMECRKTLGLPENAFIVAFTGHFIERKGPLRVLNAIELLRDRNVYGMFFGQGPQKPTGDRVLHAAPVPNDDLPVWLNAANVFVLPTLAEGSCNAINEAFACELPIITSNIKDISSQYDNNSCIMINPYNINVLASEIDKIRNGVGIVFNSSNKNKRRNNIKRTTHRAKMIYEWMCSLC